MIGSPEASVKRDSSIDHISTKGAHNTVRNPACEEKNAEICALYKNFPPDAPVPAVMRGPGSQTLNGPSLAGFSASAFPHDQTE
jgi:hypothetical protein